MDIIGINNKRTIAFQLLFVSLIGVGLTLLFSDVLYPLWGWPASSPMPGRTYVLLVIILLLAHFTGGIGSLGLRKQRNYFLTAGAVIGIILADLFILVPLKDYLRDALNLPTADLGILGNIHGNLAVYGAWLLVAWTAAAIGEEVIFRGFLLTRLEALFGGSIGATAIAVFLQAGIFGIGHAYQGPGAAFSIGVGAIFSGLVFLLLRRNLVPLIIAHGLWDSLGLSLIFMHGAPTT